MCEHGIVGDIVFFLVIALLRTSLTQFFYIILKQSSVVTIEKEYASVFIVVHILSTCLIEQIIPNVINILLWTTVLCFSLNFRSSLLSPLLWVRSRVQCFVKSFVFFSKLRYFVPFTIHHSVTVIYRVIL